MFSADEVNVQMGDRLAALRPAVYHKAVTVGGDARVAGYLARRRDKAAHELGVVVRHFFQVRDMFFGDEEYVDGRLRRDVRKGHHFIVAVEYCRRLFALGDSAEDATFHSGLLTVSWGPTGPNPLRR